MYGIPGYDDLVPDESEEGRRGWRAEVGRFLGEAEAVERGQLTPADAVTLDCTIEAATQELEIIDLAPAEYTVTAMQYAGPATFLAVAARTVLVDPAAAEAYLTRLRRSGGWFDQIGERLRTGAGRGRLPVAPLAEQAVTWAEGVLAAPGTSPVLSPQPPPGWHGAVAWEQNAGRPPGEVVHRRWPGGWPRRSCSAGAPSERAGLTSGGGGSYARAVVSDPAAVRRSAPTGLDQVALLEARAVKLGAGLGLSGLDEVFAALRDSAGKIPAEEAMRRAASAVKRAEARAGEFFPEPLPPPCQVAPMPEVVAVSGAAPHYTPPRLDGGRPGTFWFNTERPTAGTGWTSTWWPSTKRCPGIICSCPASSCSPACPPSSASAASPCSQRAGACTPNSSPRRPGCTPTTAACSARSARR
jgi:hypothetical protein